MTRSHDSIHDFDRWLDAALAGESTPVDGAIDADPDATLRSTAHQVHALLRSADRDDSVTDRLDSIREKLDMHASPSAPRIGAITGAGAPPSRRGLPPALRHRHTANAINLFLAAVLILGLGFGAWQTWSAWSTNGGGDPQPTSELAALQPEASPEQWTSESSTPEPPDLSGLEGNYVLPTADECTVEPLTVDDVLNMIEFNYPLIGYDGNESIEGSGVISADPVSEGGLPTQETMDAVAAVSREWTACIIKGSWMQVLALMPPHWLLNYGRDILFPLWSDRTSAEAILEVMAQDGSSANGPTPIDVFARYSIVIPDPATSYLKYPEVYASHVWFDSRTSEPYGIGELSAENPTRSPIQYIWNPEAATWQVFANPYPTG